MPMDFTTAFIQVIIDFQYIEEGLRDYLTRVFQFLSTANHGIVPFKYDHRSIEKDALGKLIEKFENFNDNDVLVAQLRAVVPERNQVAHQGFLCRFDENRQTTWGERVPALELMHGRLEPLLKALWNEINAFENRKSAGHGRR